MKISILGCGWLGLPLAEHLIKRGHSLKGSTTTKSKMEKLKSQSIDPYLLEFNPQYSNGKTARNFWNSDVLVHNIPPGRGKENVINYNLSQIQNIISEVSGSPIGFVVFVSSTSVYPAYSGKVKEDDAIPGRASSKSGNALLKAEELLMKSDDFQTTVLRFGGLFGGNRHPVKYLAGRKNLGRAKAPVNLIHRKDCIAVITQIIEEQITGQIFNAVADEHPSREKYYRHSARVLGLNAPVFKPEKQSKKYKIVLNDMLKRELNYTFIHSL